MTKPWSLVSRLTLWFSASTFLLVLIATASLYWSLARTLHHEDDLLISDRVQAMSQLLKSDSTNLELIKNRVEIEWANRKFELVFVRILDQSGRTVTETPGFSSVSVFDSVSDVSTEKTDPKTFRVYKVKTTHAEIFQNSIPQIYTIQIALDRTTESGFLATYRSRLLGILLSTLLITAFIGYRIAVRGIKPVSDIADAAKKIRSTTLHERIPISNLPQELTALATTFNEMLDHLNEAFERLSRFSADIAHDLRTPINNLRGELEVALGRPRSLEGYQDVLGSCLEECARISHLIDSLLFVARAEDPSAQLQIEMISLQKETNRIREFFEASTSEREIKMNLNIPVDLTIRADRALFQRALGNLISNAIHYTPPGGTVSVSAKTSDHVVEIEIADTGIGISSEHLPKVFDRFYRVDQARSAKSGGSGLGLAIVKGIMTLHRGKVEIQSNTSSPNQGTVVRLFFPPLTKT